MEQRVTEFQGIRSDGYPTNARGASSGLKLKMASAIGPRPSRRKSLAPIRLRSRMSFLRGLPDVFDCAGRIKSIVGWGIVWLTPGRYRSSAIGTEAIFSWESVVALELERSGNSCVHSPYWKRSD